MPDQNKNVRAAPLAVVDFSLPKGDFFDIVRRKRTGDDIQTKLAARWEEVIFPYVIDPIVLPYLSRFCYILQFGDYKVLTHVMRQLNPNFRMSPKSNAEFVLDIGMDILTGIAYQLEEKQGRSVISNDVHHRIFYLDYDAKSNKKNKEIRELISGPLEKWRLEAVQNYLLASTIPSFRQICQTYFDSYQKQVHKYLCGEIKQLEAFALDIESAPELGQTSATIGKFRTDTALIRLAYERRSKTSCPYTVYAPLQYAVEWHIINRFSKSWLLKQARGNQDQRALFTLRNRLIEVHGFDLHSSDALFHNRVTARQGVDVY